MTLRSPLPWIGGKFYSAERIVAAFPRHSTYKTYCDVFGGAAHVLLRKPAHNHLEVYNDACGDLVNFWMQCRNHPEELQAQIDSLPYARYLFDKWKNSDEPMDDMERAVRWFYVQRSRTGGTGGWGHQTKQTDKSPGSAHAYRSAITLLSTVAQRFRYVQIECSDFLKIIRSYGHKEAFLYCDPPYIDAEFYYQGIPPFTMADHERLAQALSATPAKVALSYYPHEALDEWYPASKWRRVTWQTYKHAEKTIAKRQTSTELLLMNYQESTQSLWEVGA